MAQLAVEGNPETPLARARALILKELGVGRVAAWCGVREMAVYKWLERGTDQRPIPPDFVPDIVVGARQAGFAIDTAVLWPAYQRLVA